jgi:hypothetical protein
MAVAAHLGLAHTLLRTSMVGCMIGFEHLDPLDLSTSKCGVDFLGLASPSLNSKQMYTGYSSGGAAIVSPLPCFIHYCSNHVIPPISVRDNTSVSGHVDTKSWHFAKRQVPHALLPSCHSELLEQPHPGTLEAIHHALLALNDHGTGRSGKENQEQQKSVRFYKNAKREAFMVCALTEAVNSAAKHYRRRACGRTTHHSVNSSASDGGGGSSSGGDGLSHDESESYAIHLVPGGWKRSIPISDRAVESGSTGSRDSLNIIKLRHGPLADGDGDGGFHRGDSHIYLPPSLPGVMTDK